eukprot:4876880-Amphidinium_carterae.1
MIRQQRQTKTHTPGSIDSGTQGLSGNTFQTSPLECPVRKSAGKLFKVQMSAKNASIKAARSAIHQLQEELIDVYLRINKETLQGTVATTSQRNASGPALHLAKANS